jgi:exonuclease III
MKYSTLLITAWNSNGISNHIPEITLYLSHNKIDVLLISETHATDRTFIKIPGYDIYLANHPDNHAHAGAAVIIRSALKNSNANPTSPKKYKVLVPQSPFPLVPSP